MTNNFTGHLLLMMAPSASGKGQLVKFIQAEFPEVRFLVSCTTREPRAGEVNGVDYFFLTHEEFQQKIDNEEFLEWAEFSGNRYGTLKSQIIKPLQTGELVLNEIELQGIQALQTLIPVEHQTIVYIEAGGWDVLLRRMKERAPMSEEHIALRHERYLTERQAKPHADVVIENHDGMLEQAKVQLRQVIEQCKAKIQANSQ